VKLRAPRLLAAGAVILIICVTVFLAGMIDRYLSARMEALKDSALAAAEQYLGRRISYQRISPSILQRIEVTNLAILEDGEVSRPLLVLRSVRISYSLLRLFTTTDPLAAVREIRVENTGLAIDMQKDRDIIQLLTRLLEPASGGTAGAFRARLVGANVNLAVTSGDTAISLTGLFFTADSAPDHLDVSIRGAVSGSVGRGFTFRSAARVQGRVGRSLDWSDATVRLLSFNSSVISTSPQSVQVVWKGSGLQIRKIQDRSPVDIQLDADMAGRTVTLRFLTDNLRPDRLFHMTGEYARLNSWLSTPVTASGSVTYGVDTGRLSYAAELEALLPDQLPVKSVAVAARFTGTESSVVFETLRMTSPEGALDFTGDIPYSSLYPQGVLTLSEMEAGIGERVSARLDIRREADGLRVQGGRLQAGDFVLDGLDLAVSPDPKGSRFRLAASFPDGPKGHTVRAEGVLALGSPPSLSVSAVLVDVPPDRMYRLAAGGGAGSREGAGITEILSQFSLSADVAVKTDFSSLSLSSRTVVLTRWDDPATRIQCGLSLEQGRLQLSGFTGSWKGLSVTGEFAAALSDDERLGFTSTFSLGGTPYKVTGSYSSALGLIVSGSYGLDVGVSFAEDGGFSFQARAERIPVPFGIRLEPVSFDVDGAFPASGPWRMRFTSLSVYDLPALRSRSNTTRLSGTLTPETLEISQLTFSDVFSTLEGSGSATYRLPPDLLEGGFPGTVEAAVNLKLKARTGVESYAATGSYASGAMDVRVDFTGVPLERLGQYALAGALGGSMHLTGEPSRPALDATLTLQNGRLGTDSIAAGGRFILGGGRLEMKGLALTYLSHALSEGQGSIRLDTGEYSFSGRYRGEFFGDRIETSALLVGAMPPGGQGSGISGVFGSRLTGALSLGSLRVNAAPVDPWGLSLRAEGGVLYFEGGPHGSIRGSLNARSEFSLALKPPLPVSGRAEGRIVGDALDCTIGVDSLDVKVLNSILKSPVISFTSGVASGTLVIKGPLNDPDWLGDLDLVGGGIVCSYSPEEVGPIQTRFTFARKTFSFAPVSAGAGSARVRAAGTFTIDHWSPSSFAIELSTEPASTVRLAQKFGRVRIEGRASGNLRVSGDDKKTEVRGAITASDCRITLGDMVKGQFVPEDPPTYAAVNVSIGRKVEFLWPSAELPVVRTYAKAGGKLAVTYRGDSGAYTIKGMADVQGGEVFYFDRSFILRSGRIVMDETQADFDPRITVRAEIREWDAKTNAEVKIYLDADNKLSHFSPRFSSDPVRPDVDILAMLGAPLMTRVESQGPMLSAVLLSSDILSQFGILRPFEQKVRELMGLDMFSFRTQLVQNLVAQKLFGTEINPLDNTSLSLGKYLGNDLFLEMLVRLNALPGTPGTADLTAGIKPDVEVNIEWATPFFLLEWSFLPKTPETLFLTDNSISLSWRIPY
jgi:translocation and assembly module TamB